MQMVEKLDTYGKGAWIALIVLGFWVFFPLGLAVLALPLVPSLILLPVLGVALNGTSSVLYGTVPELVDGDKVEHAMFGDAPKVH